MTIFNESDVVVIAEPNREHQLGIVIFDSGHDRVVVAHEKLDGSERLIERGIYREHLALADEEDKTELPGCVDPRWRQDREDAGDLARSS